jgi:hypothetical protein
MDCLKTSFAILVAVSCAQFIALPLRGQGTAAEVAAPPNWTALKIPNPSPEVGDWFGSIMAVNGSDGVLIGARYDEAGAHDAGAAYLYSSGGALVTTFTNPAAYTGGQFGRAVAFLGSDRVLVSAFGNDTSSGAAYLFSTNGALLTTFTNPTPQSSEFFGASVAAMGSDRVLIGAHFDHTGTTRTGAAHLFDTNGTLLNTFTNPTPADNDRFGLPVVPVGNDRVLIGAHYDNTGASLAGSAYLFDTNGTLLTTFTNPVPAIMGYFGISADALGTDRVLIGACGSAPSAGAAYLLRSDGTLLTTYTNPVPTGGSQFGFAVTVVGNDRVLIGANYDNTGATWAGAAYLFSTNGALLTAFTNLVPSNRAQFGCSVAALGRDQVLVGSLLDNTGAGAAYLFSLAPSLNIQRTFTNTLAISWPSLASSFRPQENTSGIATVNWTNIIETVRDDGTSRTLIVNPPTGARYYRLFKP